MIQPNPGPLVGLPLGESAEDIARRMGLNAGGLSARQLYRRRQGITATEAPAVVGLSKWKGPMRVWMEKTGRADPEPFNMFMKMGLLLEPIVAYLYAEATGLRLLELESSVTPVAHPVHRWMLATPDRGVLDDLGHLLWLAQIKTTSAYAAQLWGTEGTDEMPNDPLLQCLWEMAVCDVDRNDVPILIGGNDFRIYTVLRNRKLEAMLIERCQEFWERYVLTDTPPPVDGDPAWAEYFRKELGRTTGEIRVATPEEAELALAYKAIKDQMAAHDERRKAAEKAAKALAKDLRPVTHKLRAAIGTAAGLEGPFGELTLCTRKGRVGWESLARELGATPKQIEAHRAASSTYLKPSFREDASDSTPAEAA